MYGTFATENAGSAFTAPSAFSVLYIGEKGISFFEQMREQTFFRRKLVVYAQIVKQLCAGNVTIPRAELGAFVHYIRKTRRNTRFVKHYGVHNKISFTHIISS